jgi:hypothetical protein
VQNWLGCSSCLPYDSWARSVQATLLIVVTVAAGTYLPSRSLGSTVYSCLLRICCLATDVISLSLSRPLFRNEWCFRAVC